MFFQLRINHYNYSHAFELFFSLQIFFFSTLIWFNFSARVLVHFCSTFFIKFTIFVTPPWWLFNQRKKKKTFLCYCVVHEIDPNLERLRIYNLIPFIQSYALCWHIFPSHVFSLFRFNEWKQVFRCLKIATSSQLLASLVVIFHS